jgi:transposase
MIANLSDRQFVVVSEPVSLRKGFTGLFYVVQEEFGTVDFFNNVGYVFINRRNNMLKCLYWENDGLAIWHKRLSKGTFAHNSSNNEQISFDQLLLFLHGFVPPENRLK